MRDLIPREVLVDSPADANIFYHSECLVDGFFRYRHRRKAKHVQHREESVLADINQVLGTSHPRPPVVVNALRCTPDNT